MSGALIQLVSNNQPNNPNFNNAMNIISHSCENVCFGQSNSFIVRRECDVIKSIYFKFKMAPLPIGFVYKRCWTSDAFEQIELSIGGVSIWKTNKDKERMLNLILPKNTNKDLIFDYGYDERCLKSYKVHETIFELDIKELFGDAGIPLVSLQYSEVKVSFTLGNFMNCIEIDRNSHNLFLDPNINYILECLPQSIGLYLDTDIRRSVEENNYNICKKKYDIATTIRIPNENSIHINQRGVCSVAYVHVTNEDGTEIPTQVLDSIKVQLNNTERINLSGFQSRHQMLTLLPHATRDNNISQNLYYISYYSNAYEDRSEDRSVSIRPQTNIFENGLNTSQIDSYRLDLTYSPHVIIPERLKISVLHRTQNKLQISEGRLFQRYFYEEPVIRSDAQLHNPFNPFRTNQVIMNPVIINPITNPIIESIFTPSELIINILSDNMSCVITLEPIVENENIVQCRQCMKICNMTALNEWFNLSKTCPLCRASSYEYDFLCGKAHII